MKYFKFISFKVVTDWVHQKADLRMETEGYWEVFLGSKEGDMEQ